MGEYSCLPLFHVKNIRRPALAVLLMLCLAQAAWGQFRKIVEVKAVNGVADLRNADFAEESYALTGDWKFYPWQLLTPDSTAALAAGQPQPYPGLWHTLVVDGKPFPSQAYATYRLTVLMPYGTTSKDLALKMADVYSSFDVYIDDELFLSNGQPGTNASTTIPYFRPAAKRLHFKNDTVHILIQIANFHHLRGGPVKNVVIGNNDKLKAEADTSHAYDVFLAGCLFMGGLFFLGLFLFGSHDKSTLFFSLFCIIYTYRIVGVAPYTLHQLYPGISWFITLRLEYISLFLSIASFVQYTRYLYAAELPRWMARVFILVNFACAIVSAVLPTQLFTYIMTPYLYFLMIGFVCFVRVYLLAARHKRAGAQYALLSTAALVVVGTLLILEYFTSSNMRQEVSLVGYILFFFFQSLILSYRFAYQLKESRNLALEGIKAKSAFLSSMSHEIRTPLNSVIGIANLLLAQKPTAEQKNYLDTLLFSASHLLSVINDILDYNKMEAGKMELTKESVSLYNLGKNLITSMQVLADNKGLKLLLECSDELKNKEVLIDKARMVQVITNLIHNAIKFTHEGMVILSIQLQEKTDTEALVQIAVKDTGIGIPASKQGQIFDEFVQADSSVTREFGGTGLGLAICRKLINMLGGELKLKSEAGNGAEFYFNLRLPWSPTDIMKEAMPFEEPMPDTILQQKRILLVEDNMINAMVAEQLLKHMEPTFIIDKAVNGLESVNKFSEIRPDIILMDVNMPVMDGLEATRLIRATENSQKIIRTPIIALTAGTLTEDANRCYEAGMDTMVTKPFKPQDLKDKLIQLLLQRGKN